MNTRQSILCIVLTALGLSFVISLAITAGTFGAIPGFVDIWLRGFVLGLVAAVPAAFVIVPLARRLAERMFP